MPTSDTLRALRAALAVVLATSAPAIAEDNDWQFRVTPYVWVPSLHMDTTLGNGLATSSETEVLEILDFALLLTGEARKGDWGLLAEFNYLDLSNDFSFAGSIVQGESDLQGIMGGLAVAYRFAGDEAANADLFGGFRIWSLDAKADFRILPSVSRSTTFVDPIIGVRGSYDVTDEIFLTGLAEIGGFGAGSDLQWEVIARVGYQFNDMLAAGIGYRHLALQVDRDQVDIDAALTGPFLALDVTF